MTNALIYGGRDWDNQPAMSAFLDGLHGAHPFARVINGGQVSRRIEPPLWPPYLFCADWQAAVWAQSHKIEVQYFYANWHLDGKAAGPIRNARMLSEGRPDIGVEFPGGKGTRDMRNRLIRAGIPIIYYSGDMTQ